MPRIERLHQNTPEWHRWLMHQLEISEAGQAHLVLPKDRRNLGRNTKETRSRVTP